MDLATYLELKMAELRGERIDDLFEQCRRRKGVKYCTRCPEVKGTLLECPLWRALCRRLRVHVRARRPPRGKGQE